VVINSNDGEALFVVVVVVVVVVVYCSIGFVLL
jgi:hypothetical protein